jgi:hypothetical protein
MIYHLYSNQDATIYEKEPTLNAGLDEVLELEKVVTSTSIIEVSRILINFNASQSIASLRSQGLVSTGSLQSTLKLYSLEAIDSPVDYTISCYPVSQSWTRGTGPIDDETYKNRSKSLSEKMAGVPKSEIHRQRMSKAKLGVPKSESHKASMSESQSLVAQRAKEIMKIYPFLVYHKAIRVVGLEKKLGRLPHLNEVLQVIER